MMKTGSIFANLPEYMPEELFETITSSENVTIERIISKGHRSPEGFWYDQNKHEWAMVIEGEAKICFETKGQPVILKAGDHILIPAHCRHRVDWTDPDRMTIWIAVHF
jgi:cupin 2 domain-containing protein